MTTLILADSVCNQRFMRFSYVWFKILGLSPWEDNYSILQKDIRAEDKTSKCKFSFWGSLYNVFQVTVMFGINIYTIYSLSIWEPTNKTTLETVMIKLSFVSMICTNVIPIIYVVRQKLLINVNNQFESVDLKLNSCLDYKADYSNNNYLIFAVNLLMIIGMLIMRGVFYNSFAKVLIISWPYFISSWVIVQYVMVLNMIKVRFKNINATLSKLGTTHSKVLLSRESTLSDILSIKQAYIEICGMSEDIGSFFGLPMLIIILIFSIKSIFNLYYVILILIHVQEVDLRLYQYGLFLLRCIFLFFVITSDVTEIIQENKKTARVINFLIDRYSLDEKIKNKLIKFANELWHLKVNFSACNIIPLDRTLLGAFTGTVATYLLIAVQFRINTLPQVSS